MATLERKKKPSIITQDEEQEEVQQQQQELYNDDLANDPILENLSKEPMEYTTLSDEVVQSLQSVKHICLNVLDLLLLQIVKDLPRNRQRRLSDSSCHHDNNNVLGSITQNTNLLQQELNTAVTTTTMIRSKSSPPATSISDVYRILDSNQHNNKNNQDYTLCCSLAALLNDVYRLLELNSSSEEEQQQVEVDATTTDDVSSLQQQLHDKVSNFQQKRAAGIMTIDTTTSEEMKLIWDEMDHLMNIIRSGLSNMIHPPTYGDIIAGVPEQSSIKHNDKKEDTEDNAPPAYDTIPHNNYTEKMVEEKKKVSTTTNTGHDLDKLLDAIDRLSHVAPRLNNQRVDLTQRQVKELAAATLVKTVERLSARGRMENQRASLNIKSTTTTNNNKLQEEEVLQELIQQIHKSASRSLDNQRVCLSTTQRQNMELASIHGLINRLDKGRYTDQEWISHEELLINDLTHTTDLLVKSLNRPAYHRQRFSMSVAKERHMFMSGLFNKVESLEGYRLVNQDAELPVDNRENEDDLHQLLNHIYKSSKPQLDNQRASFTTTS